MIRVLNVISDTNLGGAGRVLLNYAKYRDRSRFEMSVALPAGSVLKDMLLSMDVTVYEIDGMAARSFDRAAVGMLKDLIRRTDPDIVHTHGSLSGRIAAKACGKKIVYTRHCAFPVRRCMRHGPGRWANRIFNSYYADRVIAVGESTKENLMQSGIPEKEIDTILNGSEQILLPPADERKNLRRRYGFSDEDFVMGIMARIEKYKGHEDILDALEILLAEGEHVKLIIAGTGSFEEELKRRAEKFPEGTVIFAGFIRNISEVLAVMDVQINASYESEASSLSVIEGMSAGVPSVVSDCGGNPDLITDGENGFVFPARDSAALAFCVRRMIKDRKLCRRLAEGSVRVYEARFTGKKFAENVEAVYEKLMLQKKGRGTGKKGDSNGK